MFTQGVDVGCGVIPEREQGEDGARVGQSGVAADGLVVDHAHVHRSAVDVVVQLGEVSDALVVIGHQLGAADHDGQQARRLAEVEAEDVVRGRLGVEVDEVDQLAQILRVECAGSFFFVCVRVGVPVVIFL